jgi:molybdenum cofactor cytidylyltransferase
MTGEPDRPRVVALVLAAGGSRRMGRPKQLAELAGRPLLEHVLAGLALSGVDEVVVALGAHADRVRAGVDLHGARALRAARWQEGMGAVLAEAAGALGGCGALLVALGDQPLVGSAVVDRLVAAWRAGAGPVVRASYGARPGHPVLFEGALLPELAALGGDAGARELLARRPDQVNLVEVAELGDDLDVDDEAALAAARRLLAARARDRPGRPPAGPAVRAGPPRAPGTRRWSSGAG